MRGGHTNPTSAMFSIFWRNPFAPNSLKNFLPKRARWGGDKKELAHRGKALIKELSTISFEMAQLVAAAENGEQLPAWFMVEIVRDLPRLVEKRDAKT